MNYGTMLFQMLICFWHLSVSAFSHNLKGFRDRQTEVCVLNFVSIFFFVAFSYFFSTSFFGILLKLVVAGRGGREFGLFAFKNNLGIV